MVKIIVDDQEQTIEKQLLNLTLSDVFDYLHYKMEEAGHPIMMGVRYQDVVFHLTCEEVDKQITPRGYEK